MLKFDPSDAEDIALVIKNVIEQSGLTLQQLAERMALDYGEKLTPNVLSFDAWWKTMSLQHALQILKICGVSEFELKLPRGATE